MSGASMRFSERRVYPNRQKKGLVRRPFGKQRRLNVSPADGHAPLTTRRARPDTRARWVRDSPAKNAAVMQTASEAAVASTSSTQE